MNLNPGWHEILWENSGGIYHIHSVREAQNYEDIDLPRILCDKWQHPDGSVVLANVRSFYWMLADRVKEIRSIPPEECQRRGLRC